MRKELMNHKIEIEREFGIVEGSKLYKIEMSAEDHLLKMSKAGVRVDINKANNMINSLSKDLDLLKSKIREETLGMVQEPNSGTQVAMYFQSIGYYFPRTSKGNPQVNQETLADISINPEIAEDILKYRKMLSAFSQLKSISKVIDSEGRVHPEYLSTKCATGRIYSKNPNIQGWGDDAKSIICADEGYHLMIADYKAQELRIIASLSKCSKMIKAFKDGIDVHSSTYAMMYGVDINTVTPEQRSIGKVLNFATIYGQTPEGLAKKLKISVERANELQNLYFNTYPEIREWLNSVIRESHRTGKVSTPWGRTRRISFNYDPAKGERQATNTPIQGAGADIIKMVLSKTNVDSEDVKVLTTIHDSVVIEYRDGIDPEKVREWLSNCMVIKFGELNLEIDIKTID